MATTHSIEPVDKLADEAFIQLAATTDRFERYENDHAVRVATLADALAKAFHLARHDRSSLRAAALLHDLGEATMERDYIQRAGTLDEEERTDLSRHTVIGEREVARVGADRAAQLIVRWHHEWWNGQGYPDALRREEIPLAARILRVADSYAALTDARPYRAALTVEAANRELSDRAGIEFDPAVVRMFLHLEPMKELESYARLGEPATEQVTSNHRRDLFSSFR